ncbi:hypothetical protein FCIRC_4014 [Fusarium circinatum]|uniref:Uncharacterized protein n=1 Tax=Fusarium circinatum TaxID=48490 RepID=A0A8H5U5G1_FUSCI|nr:hypothetical protein FCIRC_4014 [Fusarium circinatum]
MKSSNHYGREPEPQYTYQPTMPTPATEVPNPTTRIRGVVKEIWVACLISSIPLIAFSALLLGLVFHYQVTPKSPNSPSFQSAASTDPNVIYVDFPATTLIIVASWSSTMAPLILPFLLTLVSFPVSRTLIQASQSNDRTKQPTPRQYALILRIMSNASLSALWSCITYLFTSKRKRAPMTQPLTFMTWMLALASLLSMLVFAADTWLHFVTKTVLLTQFSPTTFDSGSFMFNENCTNINTTFKGGCTLNSAAANTFLINSEPSLELLANVSSTNMVQQVADSTGRSYAFVGLRQANQNANLDYTATSFGASSQCQVVTNHCISEDGIIGPQASYKCDFGPVQGVIPTTLVNAMVLTYFTDSSMKKNSSSLVSLPNPYYFTAIVSVNQNLGRNPNRGLIDDPDIASGLHGSTLFALLCSTKVLDWKYTSINGSVTSFSYSPSNASTTNIVMGTQGYTHVGDSYVLQQTSLDVWQSDTAQEVADRFAETYSRTVMGAIGGALLSAPAEEAQSRSSKLVAKIPKGPLACLLVANLLLVILGLFLTVRAFLASSSDVGDVQARLGIAALVAAHFEADKGEAAVEKIDHMFQERNGGDGPRIQKDHRVVIGCLCCYMLSRMQGVLRSSDTRQASAMANALTLSSAAVAGGSFEQQGSIDWVQIAKMSVTLPISILARVATADVSPLTIVVGQEMSSLFRLSTTGHERLNKALGELKSFSAIGDAIWFGFGIKHIVRVLAETNKGLACLTLCGCLSEIHPPKACAEILIRLASVCDAPDDLRPSSSQWINLVEACSGTLKSTTFACIAEQFMAFHQPYFVEEYRDEAEDIARALLAVARVSSGVLSSVTLAGGRSCGWIAAIGFYFLGLEIEIRSADNASVYKSTTSDDSIRILVIYGTAQSSKQVQVNSTGYFINSLDNLILSYEQRFDSVMSGTIHWSNCLSTTFGDSFGKLLKAKENFGQLIGAAALAFKGLTNSVPSSNFDCSDWNKWFGFQQSQYGVGFAHSVTSLFPELMPLRPYICLDMNTSIDDSVKAYSQAYKNLARVCQCCDCNQNDLNARSCCLPMLAETIIFLTWNVSALRIHADLKPYHSGLMFIYQINAGETMNDSSFGERYGVGRHREACRGSISQLVQLLDLASIYHTAQFLFTNNLYPLQVCKAFSATSVGGICIYFNILREVSDRPENAMILHVAPGVIQTKAGRKYSFITDRTGPRPDGLLGFDWPDNLSYQRDVQYRIDYQASITETLGGSISIPILSMDTGSSDLNVKLFVEESTSGLLVDLHFLSSAGDCRVGVYTMLKEIIEKSGLVYCTHRHCARMDQINCDISVIDGEGSVPQNLQPRIYLRRLAGNPLARCVGLFVNREWMDVPILRQGECIPCCIRTAAEMRYEHRESPSYVIL